MTLKVVASRERTRLMELADDWLADVKTNRSPRTVASYEWPVRRLAIPFMEAEGLTDPSQLDQAALNRLTNSLADKQLSAASVASYLRQINVWLRWCGERDHPGDKVMVAKWKNPGKKIRDVLTEQEVRALEDAATTIRDGLIVRVLGDTGMRLGELLRLTTADVRKGPDGHFLRVDAVKTNTQRDVPIKPPVHRRLTEYIEKKRPKDAQGDRLFVTLRRSRRTSLFEPITKRTVETLFKSLADGAGIKPERVHPHALRHSRATRLLKAGMNPGTVAAYLGMSTAVLLSTYEHAVAPDARAELMRLLAD